jgi:hypothetical protein
MFWTEYTWIVVVGMPPLCFVRLCRPLLVSFQAICQVDKFDAFPARSSFKNVIFGHFVFLGTRCSGILISEPAVYERIFPLSKLLLGRARAG